MTFFDTDILVDVIRNYPPAVTWLASLGDDPLLISGYTAFELFAWCRDGVEQQKLQRTFVRYRKVWPSPATCDAALQTYQLFHLSHGVGTFDMLIAQTALELSMPLHTFNDKHFQVVSGLQTIQPYAK